MIARHDRIMDMAIVLSLKMTHFEQKRVIRLARWVQPEGNLKEGPRVRGGRVTVEVQSKRDRNAAYVPVREPSTYLKKLRDNLFWSRLGSRPTDVLVDPSILAYYLRPSPTSPADLG